MSVESHRLLASLQHRPSFVYKCEFSQSSNFSIWWRVCKLYVYFNSSNDRGSMLQFSYPVASTCKCDDFLFYAYPLREANDGPHWAAEGAAAAETSAEQPPDVHRKSLAKRGVDPPDCRLVLLGGHARVQWRRKLSVEAVRQPEPEALDFSFICPVYCVSICALLKCQLAYEHDNAECSPKKVTFKQPTCIRK